MAAPTFSSALADYVSGAGNGVDPSPKSATKTITITAGQTVVVIFGIELFRVDSLSVSDGVNAYASALAKVTINASTAKYHAAFVAKNCAAVTAGTLTISAVGYDNGNPWLFGHSVFILGGCDTASPFVSSFTKSGSGTSLTSNAFSIAPTESIVCVHMLCSNSNNVWSAGNIGGSAATMPVASKAPAAPNTFVAGEYKSFTAAQTGITAAMNGGNFDQLAMVGIVLQAPAVGGGATTTDDEYRGSNRGMGRGIGRGMARSPYLSLEAYRRDRAREHRTFLEKARSAA